MKWVLHAAKEYIDLMLTQNPVKLAMKQTLILKNRAAIKIYLYSAVGQPDLIPLGGDWEVCVVFASLWTCCVLVTVWVLQAIELGFLNKFSRLPQK